MHEVFPLKPDGPWHEVHTEVRYGETDQMGFAHHTTAVLWFELGRVVWLREHGFPYRELEARGVLLPVSRLNVRYVAPARFEDQVVIQTRLAELTRARVILEGRILRAERDGRHTLLAEGRIELACVDPQGRVQRLPEDLRAKLAGPER